MNRLTRNPFELAAWFTAVLFAYLFISTLVSPASLISDLGLEPCTASVVLARRASMFMLGISVLMVASRGLPPSPARQGISLATSVTMVGLAATGMYEYSQGSVDSSIVVPILIETLVGSTFLLVFLANRKGRVQPREVEIGT